MSAQRTFLDGLFQAAVAAVHPKSCLPPFLPDPPTGRLIVLGAGKAAGAMTEVAERHYLDQACLPADRLSGIAVTRHGYGRPTRRVPVIEAGHPVPDAAGVAATETRSRSPTLPAPDDLVLVLLSGGASANWIAPAAGLSLAEKQAVTRALLALRRHRSARSTRCESTSRASRAGGSRARIARAPRHARHLRRARRRPGGDRLRPDRARSDDARRRARGRRALPSRPARTR